MVIKIERRLSPPSYFSSHVLLHIRLALSHITYQVSRYGSHDVVVDDDDGGLVDEDERRWSRCPARRVVDVWTLSSLKALADSLSFTPFLVPSSTSW